MDRSLEDWLAELGLERYLALFRENEVDLATLRVLSEDDLKELGLPFGPRKRILSAATQSTPVQSAAGESSAAPAGERRQLTVLFCDMVGFTELASSLDPEVLQAIINAYEDTCAACVTRYEGYVFQRLGDGIVAFFGYPLAHEGEAERAMRAGLDILVALEKLEVPEVGRIQARIGVATGVVVVTSAERGAVGETMNLASRLQGIAPTGSLVVSERVRRLGGGAFEYEDLGPQSLKGIARPTRAYRVLGRSDVASRFEAASGEDAPGGGLARLVGREGELELLLGRWERAREGCGGAVLVMGEAGIGKSRVIEALRERVEGEGVQPLRFQCSPYYTNSAFYPEVDHLERALGVVRDAPVEVRLDELEELVVERCGLPREDVRYLAALLSLPYEDRYGELALPPREQKEETIRAVVDLILASARERPGLMLFEDVHWADPTSLEVLDQLVERLADVPLLLVLNARPEFEPRWSSHEHAGVLHLARLTRAQSSALVARETGGKPLPPELLEQIIEKTDGVPLFVEELTRTILESGGLLEESDRYTWQAGAEDLSIPATLRDSLMARLDRVLSVKEIAQVGAVIGREFSYELLAAVTALDEVELRDRLARLTESGLASRSGDAPTAVFTFKHALLQDAAYDSLLKSRRKELHGEIAHALEERFPARVATEPELLAQHYTAAGRGDAAVPYWLRAGEVAQGRFALREAVAHLRRGLELVGSLPEGPERDREELELRTLLGPALVALRGWADPEVGAVLEPAWTLAESLDRRPCFLPVLHGLWVHTMCVGELAVSLGWAKKLMTTGGATGDGNLEIVGHRAAAASYFWMGELASAREHGDVVWSTYDAEKHWHIVPLTNTDPLTGDGIYRGQYLWMLGHPEQAIAASEAKDEHARERGHPFDMAFALTLGAQVFDFLAEPDELLRRTEEAERVAREHRVPLMSEVMAEISRGVAWLRAERFEESARQLREAVDRLSATGHRIWIWYLRALLAEAVAGAGDPETALAIVAESAAHIARGEDRVHHAEVLRVKGAILAQLERPTEAEEALRQALEVARAQGARGWELRAATTLAGLLAAGGRPEDARTLLEPVWADFAEGHGTRDLRAARELLDSLSRA